MIMLIELIAIIVSMFFMAILLGGGNGFGILSLFIDIPSLICILLLSLPILVKNGVSDSKQGVWLSQQLHATIATRLFI